jgi:hypothetical protein
VRFKEDEDMELELPQALAEAMAPLFRLAPMEGAMTALVVTSEASPALVGEVSRIVEHPAIDGNPGLAAGLWLYIDDLDRSHTVSQGMDDETGSFWHGIMHRREGDFSNSHYWFRRVGRHPAMALIPGYDAHAFIDAVAAAHAQAPEALVQMQRAEWQALFRWCATASSGNA